MTQQPAVNWHKAAPHPVALVFLPWKNGVTIAHRGADGNLYGCRDVSNGPGGHFHQCIAAWIETRGALALEDHANVKAMLQAGADRLQQVSEHLS